VAIVSMQFMVISVGLIPGRHTFPERERQFPGVSWWL
jgi:hypothetical protein